MDNRQAHIYIDKTILDYSTRYKWYAFAKLCRTPATVRFEAYSNLMIGIMSVKER